MIDVEIGLRKCDCPSELLGYAPYLCGVFRTGLSPEPRGSLRYVQEREESLLLRTCVVILELVIHNPFPSNRLNPMTVLGRAIHLTGKSHLQKYKQFLARRY